MARIRHLLLSFSLAAWACQSPQTTDPAELVFTRVSGALTAADVAVLPVEVLEGAGGDPGTALRAAVQRDLVARGFSPLARSYVERRAGAAWPEACVLELRVHRWNDARAASSGKLDYDVELRLSDAGGGTVAHLRRRGEKLLSNSELAVRGPEQRRELLLDRVVAEVLEPLPGCPPL